VLIAGGSDERDWHGKLSSTEIYDPATGKFSSAAALNDARFKLPDTAEALNNGEVIIAGGSREVEIFDPSSAVQNCSGTNARPAPLHDRTKLKDGSVLLAGGYPDNDAGTAETWLFRP